MDRPGHDDRKRTPLGDRRETPARCLCGARTMNLIHDGGSTNQCDDCLDAKQEARR